MKNIVLTSLVGLALGSAGSARANEVTHEIQQAAPPTATVGVPAKASLTVQGKNGWHVNEEAPITLTLKADPGVELPKAKLARADLAASSKESARFDIAFSGTEAGKKTITGEARFVMCQEQACKPEKAAVTFPIEVVAASPAAKPDKSKPAKKSPAKTKPAS